MGLDTMKLVMATATTLAIQAISMSDVLYDRVVAAVGHQYELDGEIGRGP